MCLLFSGNYKKEIMGPPVIPLWTRKENKAEIIGLYAYLMDKGQKCGRDLHWVCIRDSSINERKAVSDKCAVMDVSLYVKQNGALELVSPANDRHHLAYVPLDIGDKEIYLKLKVPDNWPKNRGYETMFRVILKPAKFYRYSPLDSPFDGEVM